MKKFFTEIFKWWIFWWAKHPVQNTIITLLIIGLIIVGIVFGILDYTVEL